MILTGIQMQAKVICWTLFLWHDCFRCEGKLTVPSSWTSWKLSLRWASYKVQCECTWTSLLLSNPFIFRPTNISLFQKGSIYQGVWTWLKSKSKRGEKLSKQWRKCVNDHGPNVQRPFSFNQTLPFQGSRTGAQNGKNRYLTKSLLHKNKRI